MKCSFYLKIGKGLQRPQKFMNYSEQNSCMCVFFSVIIPKKIFNCTGILILIGTSQKMGEMATLTSPKPHGFTLQTYYTH